MRVVVVENILFDRKLFNLVRLIASPRVKLFNLVLLIVSPFTLFNFMICLDSLSRLIIYELSLKIIVE